MRRISVAILSALFIPVCFAAWISWLTPRQNETVWNQPDTELKARLEHQLIFSFSPLIAWVNGMQTSAPPTEKEWTEKAYEVLKASPELRELTWLISEQGVPRVYRQESRSEEGIKPIEQMDPEIFQYVKNGERPYGFAYKEGEHSLFEFQIPLVSGSLFSGILVARYSLPDILKNLVTDLPPHVSVELWNNEQSLATANPLSEIAETVEMPLEIWGKKLTLQIHNKLADGRQSYLVIQWFGFLVVLSIFCLCFAWRKPSAPIPGFASLSFDWFSAKPAESPAPPPATVMEDGPLPVWAIAQKEKIDRELKKGKA